MFKAYYHLTKPGIIYGNAFAAIAGFLLASKGNIDWTLFIYKLAGLSLVIASACVFNNVLDKDVDIYMQRTKQRSIVTGEISKRNAIIFSVVLFVLGVIALHHHTTMGALIAALIGFVVYVFMYTPSKRKTLYSTHIGSISGAMPPVVGYLAVTNHVDVAVVLLFAILVIWQMPHFYAIGIFRLHDYTEAGLPILPVKRGVVRTKISILLYIIALGITLSLLTLYGYTGYTYLIVMLIMTLVWLWYFVKKDVNDAAWARKLFRVSLFVLLCFCVTVSFGKLLP